MATLPKEPEYTATFKKAGGEVEALDVSEVREVGTPNSRTVIVIMHDGSSLQIRATYSN